MPRAFVCVLLGLGFCISCAHTKPRAAPFSGIPAAAPNPAETSETPEKKRRRALVHLLKLSEKPSYTALDIRAALQAGRAEPAEGIETLLEALDDAQEDVRENARQLLWQLPPEFLAELVRICPKRHRALAAQIAASRGAAGAYLLPEILSWYDETDEDAAFRMAVFNSIGVLGGENPEVRPHLRRGLSDPDERIRLFAVSFLIDDPESATAVRAVLSILRLSRDPSISDCAGFWWNYQKIRFAQNTPSPRP